MMHDLIWWVLHVLGVDNLSGPWYGFWSGIAGDTAFFAAAGVATAWFRAHRKDVVSHHREHTKLLREQNELLRRMRDEGKS